MGDLAIMMHVAVPAMHTFNKANLSFHLKKPGTVIDMDGH